MIIFLNGASSSGKSSIARAIQHLAKENFLTLGHDTFVKMMPYGMLGFKDFAREGFFFEYMKDVDPRIKIHVGPFAEKLLMTAGQTCAMLAKQGFNLIIDEVILKKEFLQKYITTLNEFDVYFVKVYCDLKILQEREILRGDRSWGLAKDQFLEIHKPEYIYDLEVDNSSDSCFANAEKILNFIGKNKPSGFKKMESVL